MLTNDKLTREEHDVAESRYRDILDALPLAVYATDAEGRVTFSNKAAAVLAGREPALGDDRWCVSWRLYNTDGSFLPHDQCPLAKALREQRPISGEEIIVERPDGGRFRCQPHPVPLFNAQGSLIGAVNLLVDVTDQHRASVEAAHLAAIVASSDDAIISKDLEGVVQSWNAGAERIFGYSSDEMVGQPIRKVIPQEQWHEEDDILGHVRRGERVDHLETVRVTKSGAPVDISVTVSPVRDRTGRIIGASKIARDIGERKRADAVRELLLNELNHRVKNTLTTVQSIAHRTFASSAGSEHLDKFAERLSALAVAQDLLTGSDWNGARLQALVEAAISPFTGMDGRVDAQGPTVMLNSRQTVGLSLALHELARNATKYGALSNATGRISLRWHLFDDGKTLVLQWQEAGGPKVTVPEATGFGTLMITRALQYEFGAEADISYAPDGVACSMKLAL